MCIHRLADSPEVTVLGYPEQLVEIEAVAAAPGPG